MAKWNRIDQLAGLIQGKSSQPLKTKADARKCISIARDVTDDRESIGRFAAYLLDLMAKQRAGGLVSRVDLARAASISCAVARRSADPLNFGRDAVHYLLEARWCGVTPAGGLLVTRQTREAARFLNGGVSLRDAALIIFGGDEIRARRRRKQWMNCSAYGKLKPIGKDPKHKQQDLFKPSGIYRFVEEFEGKRECDNRLLRDELAKRVRPPRH